MNKEDKIQVVNNLTSRLAENKNIYFTDISGLNAEDTSRLRRMCFDKGVMISVVKNTLLRKAMDACDKDFSDFHSLLKGNTALMTSDISNAPAKVIKSFIKKTQLDNPSLKGGHVEESIYIGSDQLDVLASLKSKEELIGDLLTLLQSPMMNLISSLNSAKQNISGVLKTLESGSVNNIKSDNKNIESDKISADEKTAQKEEKTENDASDALNK